MYNIDVVNKMLNKCRNVIWASLNTHLTPLYLNRVANITCCSISMMTDLGPTEMGLLTDKSGSIYK